MHWGVQLSKYIFKKQLKEIPPYIYVMDPVIGIPVAPVVVTDHDKEIYQEAIRFTIIYLNNQNVIKKEYANLGLIKAVQQELEKR